MSDACERCGAFGDLPHGYVENDCLLPHNHGKPRHPPLAQIGWACTSCVDKHHDWLREIVDLFATLTQVLAVGSIPDDTADHKRPKKQPASPAPLRLDAWALLHPAMLNSHLHDGNGGYEHVGMSGVPDVNAVLTNWAAAVYDQLAWGLAPDTISGAATVLQAHDAILYSLPDLDTYDAELRWVRKHLRSAHGLTDPMPLGRCLTVTCRGNVWPDGKCDHCGRRYERLDLVRLKVNEEVTA